MALSVGDPLAFLRPLLRVSTNLSACPLLLGWYGGIVTCYTRKSSQKCLNSVDVNCVALSVTTLSTTPNLTNSSWRKDVVNLGSWLLTFQDLGPFRETIY